MVGSQAPVFAMELLLCRDQECGQWIHISHLDSSLDKEVWIQGLESSGEFRISLDDGSPARWDILSEPRGPTIQTSKIWVQ